MCAGCLNHTINCRNAMQDLDAIVNDALALFGGISDAAELEQTKARYLGKSGAIELFGPGAMKLDEVMELVFVEERGVTSNWT